MRSLALALLVVAPMPAWAGVVFGYGHAWHSNDVDAGAANLGIRMDGKGDWYYAGSELELGFPTDGDTLHTMINLGVVFAPLVSDPLYAGVTGGGGFMFGPLGAGAYAGGVVGVEGDEGWGIGVRYRRVFMTEDVPDFDWLSVELNVYLGGG